MSDRIFTPNFKFDNPKVKMDSSLVFDRFLSALESTEQEREDILVKVSNFRPHMVGDLSQPFDMSYDIMNETKKVVNETINYSFHPSTLNQLASIDNPPIPLAWLKNSFDGKTEDFYDFYGVSYIGYPKIDLRQQILRHAFKKRKRMERIIRIEKPYYLNAKAHFDDSNKLYSVDTGKQDEMVMGIVGKNYPTEWSTSSLMNALYEEIHNSYNNVTWDHPYVTTNGTFRIAFHTEDPAWRFEPKKGDIIGFGGVLRDNPYGGGSLCWHPRALRLSCINGMTYYDRMGSVIISHRSWVSMVTEIVDQFLKPRLNKETLEPINNFEKRIPNPLPIADYLEEHSLLYSSLAKVMLIRLSSTARKMNRRFKTTANMLLQDYKTSLDWICGKYEIGDRIKERLHKVAVEDVTIPDPESDEFSVYDLSNVFSTYANSPLSDEQRNTYSTIAGEIVMKPILAEQLIAITAE